MELRSSSRADPVDGTNIFHTAVEIYGQNCFLHKKKVLDVRGFLYRHIRLHQNYRCVVEKVAIQALQFVSGPNPGSKTNQRNTVPQKWEALFLAVHLCQKYNLQNPAVVKPLMRSVLNFKDNVGSWDWRWFRILNPFAPVRVTGKDILYPFKPNGIDPFDEWPTDRHLEALEYFLKFAKFRFQTIQTGACNIVECPSLHDREDILWPNECDFIDCPLRILTGVSVPLAQACQSCNPKVVLFLLRHGATPVFKEELTYWKLPYTFIPEQPLDPILSMLNSCATWRCRSNAFPNIDRRLYASFEAWETKQEEKALACLRLFCRVLPSIPVTGRPSNLAQLARYLDDKEYFFLDQIYMKEIPENRTISPAELQHLCRCRIRRRLKYLMRLPMGVYELPLPVWLQRYVDLEYD